jgi:imidazoleglycerol-phosphate dehydratase
MRSAVIERKTSETEIYLKLDVDGSGQYEVETGIGFLDHMLELFAKHGSFDLSIGCNGDLYVDMHHTVEDIGICLGKAFYEAVGDCKGIYRYGNMILPMDEALVLSAVDFGGRAYLGYDVVIPTEKVGDFDTELVKEFFIAFTSSTSYRDPTISPIIAPSILSPLVWFIIQLFCMKYMLKPPFYLYLVVITCKIVLGRYRI